MAHKLPAQIIDLMLLGAPSRRRQLQDLPILGDVWTHLAEKPDIPPDLLVVPCWGHQTAEVAELLEDPGEKLNERGDRSVAAIDRIVVATLSLDDLIGHVLPYTTWWKRLDESWDRKTKRTSPKLARWVAGEIRNLLPPGDHPTEEQIIKSRADIAPDGPSQTAARLGVLLGTLIAARVEDKSEPQREVPDWHGLGSDPQEIFAAAVGFLEAERIARLGTDAVATIFKRHLGLERGRSDRRGSIFQVTLNRPAELALIDSVPAIKADAARGLFSISCAEIGWAVVDSGIDHRHPAFRDQKLAHKIITASKKLDADPDKQPFKSEMRHRIRAAFDFTRIRAILGVKREEVATLCAEICPRAGIDPMNCARLLEGIITDRTARQPIDWRKVEPLITLKLTDTLAPDIQHGTHVAGIIGADWQVRNKVTGNFEPRMTGVCPDIRLYDFRVLGSTLGDSEFAVSSALQFIRYFNQQAGHQRIHGVNLSLAIRHNVRNYACGQTPVCKEAEALVANGVVVVAAAGNRGYLQYQLADQSVYEGYAASSITDPGNADGVITVGATHRSFPHTYGVSFFSSRGPTGDGRLKPDLLAPGEKIVSCVGMDRQDAMDGTSMAAPHVSGAAALLMARHEELRGNPVRIKQVLCSTATDLKRERQFQGHGMVDVLRAIQSI